MKEYIIYMTGTSGVKYKFHAGQSTVNTVDQFTAGGRRFLWFKDEHAVNLDNIEHIQIHEIEEGEKTR